MALGSEGCLNPAGPGHVNRRTSNAVPWATQTTLTKKLSYLIFPPLPVGRTGRRNTLHYRAGVVERTFGAKQKGVGNPTRISAMCIAGTFFFL